MIYSKFLRTVLKVDSATCLASAAMLVPGAALLAGPFGIAESLLYAAGLALIPIGLYMAWLGVRGEGPAALVWLVILGNLGWVAGSFGLVATLSDIQPLGAAYVIAQGFVVLALALLEWRGLRQSSAAMA